MEQFLRNLIFQHQALAKDWRWNCPSVALEPECLSKKQRVEKMALGLQLAVSVALKWDFIEMHPTDFYQHPDKLKVLH